MDPNHHSKPHHPLYNPLQCTAVDPSFEPYPLFSQHPSTPPSRQLPVERPSGVPLTQTATAYAHFGVFHTQDTWDQALAEDAPFVGGGSSSMGMFPTQPQHTYLSYEEKGVQTTDFGPIGGNNDREEQPQGHRQLTPCHPVSQKTYIATRLAGFSGPEVIQFVVNGEEGIRLLDALEGNWIGFERRDDRSFFGGDRPQIIIRLHPIGCSPWQSKISTKDFTKKRRPITRMKLAIEVAKSINKFMAREKSAGHGCRWEDVSLGNVFLTRMVRVSAASWQPEIFVLELPSVASEPPTSSISSLNFL